MSLSISVCSAVTKNWPRTLLHEALEKVWQSSDYLRGKEGSGGVIRTKRVCGCMYMSIDVERDWRDYSDVSCLISRDGYQADYIRFRLAQAPCQDIKDTSM